MSGCTDRKKETKFIIKKVHAETSDANETAAGEASWKNNILPVLLQDFLHLYILLLVCIIVTKKFFFQSYILWDFMLKRQIVPKKRIDCLILY